MKKIRLSFAALLLTAALLLPLSGCARIGEALNGAINGAISDFIAGHFDAVPQTDPLTAPEATTAPETAAQWVYAPDPAEQFPDEAARIAAGRADPAIAAAYAALNVCPDDPSVVVLDYDPAAHPTEYSRLTDERRALYDTVYAAVSEFAPYSFDEREEKTGFIQDFLAVNDALRRDHPDLFMYYTMSSKSWKLFPDYFLPNGDPNEPVADPAGVRAAAGVYYRTFDRILDRMPEGISNYQKCIYLCAVICELTTYDYTYAAEWDEFPTYGTLVTGVAVCEGYAEAFFLLARAAGVEVGRTWGDVRGEPHVWNNLMTADGKRYFDVTWTDNTIENHSYPYPFVTDYFLMTETDLAFNGYENIRDTAAP